MSLLVAVSLLIGPAYAADGGGSASLLVGGLVTLVVACAALVAARPAVGALATSLAGIGTSGWLTVQHHAAKAGRASMCNISESWSCDVVNTSAWSELGSVPIALVGLGFYAGMAWLAWRASQGAGSRAPAMMLILASVAVCVDAFLGLQMLKLQTGCTLCLTTYALNLALLVASARLAATMDVAIGVAAREAIGKDGVNAAIAGIGAVILGGMVLEGEPSANAAAQTGRVEDLAALYEAVPGPITLDGAEPTLGDPNARFTLVEWADFQCPHCAFMFKELKVVLEQNKDTKLHYRNYPISHLCNRFVEGDRHSDSCNAAAAGECGLRQGRFWELAQKMFANQEYLGKDDVRFMVGELGLDAVAFEQCMGDPAIAEAVRADVERGGAAGVQGTPSIYLHGPWGDQWARIHGDGEAISMILAASRSGETLPPPPPPPAQPHG